MNKRTEIDIAGICSLTGYCGRNVHFALAEPGAPKRLRKDGTRLIFSRAAIKRFFDARSKRIGRRRA